MRTVRVWFTKLGRARFISHLDINRCMARAVRRAEIPLWYTEGFNPHPYMTFSLPLSLGIESRCESMDIRIEGEMADEEIHARLSAVMPEGIQITGVFQPLHKAKEIAYAEYEIRVEAEQPEEACERIEKALQSGELVAQKKGKQGRKRVVKEVNLSEYILRYGLVPGDGAAVIHVVLFAGTVKNVNPVLLAGTVVNKAGLGGAQVRLTRQRLLLEDGSEFR